MTEIYLTISLQNAFQLPFHKTNSPPDQDSPLHVIGLFQTYQRGRSQNKKTGS